MHGGRAVYCTGVVQYVARVHIIYRYLSDIFQRKKLQRKERKGMIILIGGVWYRVPDKILTDPTLTRSDIAVFAVIADRADGGSCTLAASEIASLTACCIRTVKTSTKRLSERGYISIERAAGGASTYKQLLLEPKRRGKKKAAQESSSSDIEKYNVVINRFDESEVVG